MEPNATMVVQNEAMDEKGITFTDETGIDGEQAPEDRTSRQVPDEELDETFSDSRASDMTEYNEDENYNDTPHETNDVTFEDIGLAMQTVKRPRAAGGERRHAGIVFCDMKGSELFALTGRNSDTTHKELNELMDYYLDSVSAAQAKSAPAAMPKKAPAVPDNFEDFSIHDLV